MGQLNDLVYADSNLLEMGILDTYNLDFDTNDNMDFEIQTPFFVMDVGYFFFIDGTEYGGRIDSMESATNTGILTYTGRNFRGILNSHIIPRDTLATGDIRDEINARLREAKLSTLFICDLPEIEPGVSTSVENYQYTDDTTLYYGITALAKSINLNLTYEYRQSDQKVHIIPIFANDYSDYLTYCRDNSLDFTIGINEGNINHLIVWGEDDEGITRRIHLFTDDSYGLLSYKKDSPNAKFNLLTETWDNDFVEPTQDSDYILDQSQQQLFGLDEIADVIEYTVEVVNNYIMTEEKPEDWSLTYPFYYTLEVDEEGNPYGYDPVEPAEASIYTLTTSKPSDWNNNYDSYYTHTGTGTSDSDFSSVRAEEVVDGYTTLSSKPNDWVSTYNLYYTRYWDGDDFVYSSVSGNSRVTYALQTKQPDNWNSNYNRYFYKNGSSWANVSLVKSGKSNVVPTWVKNKYYTQHSTEVAPSWPGRVFIRKTKKVTPTWTSGTYYKRTVVQTAPAWRSETYYEKVEDHYTKMIESAKQTLIDSIASDGQKITLENFEVNVGDTVGGIDEVTGLSVNESVTNIVVKYENGIRTSINYTIGGYY